MKRTNQFKRILSLVLAMVMVFGIMPVNAQAAVSGRESDTIFFATDRHEESSKLKSLLQALQYAPGLVVLGGDHVNNTNSGSLASITSEIQSVYPGVQTFYTYAAHDPNVSADNSNPYAYARTGEYYEGEDYYVYGVDQNDMQSASSAATASANFKSWAASVDSSKVIFVMCHMPIHNRRGDNAGGATWMNALNEVGNTHDVVFLWGHNHTGENSSDTSVYFVGVGGSLTPQGGSKGTINFTYMNAGYIKNGYCSMAVVNSDAVHVTRYNTSGSATANYTIQRRFAQTHTWEVTEYVAATCTAEGHETKVCADCGEVKTSVIAAKGHAYSSVVQDTCTGSYTIYTCGSCGHSYSEENATETAYDAVSVLTEGESYVIVASNYALTQGSSAGKTSVTVSNGSITSNVTDAMIWTYTSGKLYNEASGTYLNYSGSSSRKTITFSSSGVSVSYSANKLKLGSYYLYYSSSSGFSARSSGSTVTLYQVNEAFGGTGAHTYETVTVQPTCTEDGSITYTCTACGYSYCEILPASADHHYETLVTAPTCTEKGYTTYTCTLCGESHIADEVAPLGHEYEIVTVAATCTAAGSATYTCSCGDSYVETIPALGHSYETVTTEATCTEDGSVVCTCACGDTYTQVIPAVGHQHEAVVTAPTCERAGYTTHVCVCGDSYITDEVAALGHQYEAIVTAPTCESAGYTTYICLCGDSYITDEVAALGHQYEAVVTAPTCESAGYTTHICVCGDSYITDEVAALGHQYEAVVTAPTCETVGYTTHVCSCGDSYITDEISALGHKYETVTTEATCTEEGSIVYTCGCGDTYTQVIPMLEHDRESVVTAPTCENEGYTTHTCRRCGEVTVDTVVSALGHSYTHADADGYRTYSCVRCGHSYSEQLSFSYEQVSAFTSGERFVITVKSGSKYYALSHSGNKISAVQVTVSGGKITSQVTEDLLWSYDSSKLSYESEGTTYYLYTSGSGWWWGTTTLGISADDSGSISLSSGKLMIGSKYLRYSSSKFSVSSSGSTVYLFQEK